MVGLFSKAACLSTYAWVHTHYRLVDLPWNSPWTWILTAVLVDLGYYWFHRASHEVGVLWAVYQVHHSSEEFNLTTAFRQPFFQGLFQLTHWFYLPAALAVPPSQFLVHSQFVFLFQFWIHSELIGDIGPLGLIFNTSTYHQVHHGSNRYCLDKNYGGFLSIPDRKESTIVLVQTVPVRPMVHLVVSGGVEYEAKRADVTNQLGVNPKLEEENKLGVDKEL